MNLIIGIGEYGVSNNEMDLLKTYALSSCVAVTAYCNKRKIAGMVHIALPSPNQPDDDRLRPSYYATKAVPTLISKICLEFGCPKDELEIRIFGGAKSIRNNDVFNIGEKNINAVEDALRRLSLKYKSAEVGGTQSRSLEMDVTTGGIKVTRLPLTI